MFLQHFLLFKVAAPLLAFTFPFFNFLSGTNVPQTPAVACEQPSLGKSALTNTMFNAGDSAIGDFNNDGKLDFAIQYGSQNTLVVQNGKGNGLFEAPRVIDNNSSTFSVTTADFNNDGKLDLLTQARIYLGDGAGNFPQSRLLQLGSNTLGFVSGDFNGDDKPDIAGLVFSNGTMEVYFGDGSGGFSPVTQVAFPSRSIGTFDISDVNGDGISDIIATFSNVSGVGVMLGGANGFQTPAIYPIPGNGAVSLITSGDVDGDGDKDIYTWGSASGSAPFTVLLLNNGNGKFAPQTRVPDEAGDLTRLNLFDVNNDGKLDLIANIARGLFSVRLGNNTGTFQGLKLAPAVSGVGRVFFEDFTGDGIRDLGVNSTSVNSIEVLVNDGVGNFGVDQKFVDDFVINDTATADFNEDGKPDVVTASDSSKVWVAFGNGNGLGSMTSVTVSTIPRYVLTGDLNNDNHQDILAFLQTPGPSTSAVIYGNGDGTFQAPIQTSFPDFRLSGGKPALVNIDGDPYIDLVAPSAGNTNRVGVYQNSTQGFFQSRGVIDVGSLVGGVAAGDFDQDGKTDLAILSGSVSIYLGTGTYTFSPLSVFPAGGANAGIFTADLNGDGILDLAATQTQIGANGTNGKVAILMGVGKGGFSAPAEYILGRGPKSMAAADFDGDGIKDLAVTNQGTSGGSDDRVSILYGNGQGLFPRLSNTIVGVSPRGLEAADFDSDGKPDLVTSDFSLGLISLARNSCLPAPATNLPSFSINTAVDVPETDAQDTAVTLAVNLSAPSSVPVRVRYYTAPFPGIDGLQERIGGLQENELFEAAATRDYIPVSGELLFLPGETSKNVTITVKGDLVDEFDEKFVVYLINANNAVTATSRSVITIIDNDAPPALSIGNASQAEGNSGSTVFNFPVTLSAQSEKPIFVQYNSGGGTATANQDYTRAQGTLTIQPNQTQGVITVSVNGDLTIEPDETFLVDLSNASNATIANSRGTGTIVNDDAGGTIQFSAATYTTNDTTNQVIISVTRTGGIGGGASVRFRTQAGTATPGQDYTEVTTNLVFGDNETTKNVIIPIVVDTLDEPDETVNLIIDNPVNATLGTPSTAVLTIQDLEDQPNLTIADASVIERDSGTTTMQFFLKLSRPTQRPVSVSFATADDTATAGSDYLAASGTFTIQPGVTRKAITVTVLGDFQFEQDETFFVNLSNAVNANLTDNQAIGRILNDEVNTTTQTTLISINRTENGSGNSDSFDPGISADGKLIVFETFASNLAETPDTNNQRDIYVRNTQTRETKLVSVNNAGTNSGNCDSTRAFISANGRFVAFNSCAADLLSTPVATTAVFVRDLQTNQTRLVSANVNGTSVTGDVVAISADGRFIAYQSRAQNVTTIPDTQNFQDIFVRDMQTGVTQLVSVNTTNTAPGNADSGIVDIAQKYVKISDNGRYVIFPSTASNLVSATSSGAMNIFVRDLQTQTTIPVSSNLDNTQLVGGDSRSCLTSDGRYAFFSSAYANYVPNDTNNSGDIFRRDLLNNTVILVSYNSAGTATGSGNSTIPYCSADGRYVAFETTAGDLSVTPDTNTFPDVYWRDISAGMTKLVTVNSAGTNAGNLFSSVRGLSDDGQVVFFMSAAGDLLDTPIDNNANFDIFIRDMTTSRTNVVSVNESGTTVGNLGTTTGQISRDGKVVTYSTAAYNLVPIDTNTTGTDVFAFSKTLPMLPLNDFDGDGKTDLSVFRPSDTVWYITNSQDGSYRAQQFGLSQDVPVANDYDGDGKTDIAVFRNGAWYIFYSRNNTFAAFSFGQAGDIPVPADYDGDRRTDLAVFRDGVWQIKESSDGNIRTQQFGLANDIPVQADYDGDRRADIAVFREGVWYVFQSTDFNVRIEQFGIAADKPVQGDFDGDAKVDFAVFRPSNGGWYAHLSGNGSYLITQFGISTDTPLKGDFDGDKKADVAVFREGVWYITQSSDQNIRITQFGIPNDIPIPR
jgi:hypothetical protein